MARKQEENIRANVTLRSKTLFWVFIIISVIIIGQLLIMQVFKYNYYRTMVINNIQQETLIKAERGTIYDRNMQVLATNTTTYRVFISPVDIQKDDNENQDNAKLISQKLSEILGLSYDEVYAKTQKANRKDETIKKNVDKETSELISAFKNEHKFNTEIYLEPSSTRYYPKSTLASNVIGVMGTDKGMFGLELEYDEYLKGTDGKYITTKNGQSQSLPSSYEYYVNAEDGLNVITTLDLSLQSMLEAQLKQAYDNSNAGNKVAGIVMDVTTGGILAMGQYPALDLNSPYALDSDSEKDYEAYKISTKLEEKLAADNLTKGTEEYNTKYDEYLNDYYWQLVYSMWYNKVVSDTYEPGSTFKVITTAMALEEGVTTFSDMYSCAGIYSPAKGVKIKCHVYPRSHGTQTYAVMLQQSCNPTLMQVAAKVGASKFFAYFSLFGYTFVTGIDLPGEASGIYRQLTENTPVELACYSFGQTFKTTMISQITAISAVANGGYLVTPKIVSSLVDNDGNVVVSYGTDVKRQVVSSSVCTDILNVLEEGVSGGGGAKNAYVAGYKIAAKTGTSEKRDTINPLTGEKDLRIGSCVAIAPADNPKIAVLIIVDEPDKTVTSIYGSVVAAPYVANFLEQALPYIGVEREYSEDEMSRITISVKNYSGYKVESAKVAISKLGLTYEIIGSGDTVVSQMPTSQTTMTKVGGKIILYTGGASSTGKVVTVPNVTGMSVQDAINKLRAQGLNVLINGSPSQALDEDGKTIIEAKIASQETPSATEVKYGTVITITCRYDDEDDTSIEIEVE